MKPNIGPELMTLRSGISWDQELDTQPTEPPKCPNNTSIKKKKKIQYYVLPCYLVLGGSVMA